MQLSGPTKSAIDNPAAQYDRATIIIDGTAGEVYSTLGELKNFFQGIKCSYDTKLSSGENIIRAQNAGKIPTDTIITFKNIFWEIPPNTTYTLNDNIRLEGGINTGEGVLKYKNDWKTESSRIHNDDEVNLLLGVNDVGKSISVKLFEACERGTLPNCFIAFESGIDFSAPDEKPWILPKNVWMENATVSHGQVESVGHMIVLENATGVATEILSTASTSSPTGKACAKNAASAKAMGCGKAFALDEGTSAYADGAKAKAYGLKAGTTLYLSNGATGFVRKGVTVVTDGSDCKVFNMPCHEDAPPAYLGGKVYMETEKSRNYQNYLRELKDLADVGDAKSAYALGMVDEDKLKAAFPTGGSRIDYLKLALELGKKEAAVELCHSYIRLGYDFVGEGWWHCADDTADEIDKQRASHKWSKEPHQLITTSDFEMSLVGIKNVGRQHASHKNMSQDIRDALKYFEIAKENGSISKKEIYFVHAGNYLKSLQKPGECIIS